jgi:hypothetical protein
MAILHIGLEFDNNVYCGPGSNTMGQLYAGPKKLLFWLEGQLGLSGYPENTDYLRIELYRQALLQWIAEAEHVPEAPKPPFYSRSFEADRFATAAALLGWRDELRLAGWDFQATAGCPQRLTDLANVEPFFLKKINNPEIGVGANGFADRFDRALLWLESQDLSLTKIYLHEPEAFQAPVVRRLLALFRQKNIPIETLPQQAMAADANSDLAKLQAQLSGAAKGKNKAANDGSILVLKARRDSDAAVFLAQWLSSANPALHPVFLIPELNRVLEQALVQEGLPAMGVLSASLARPSLQVLKLAPAFLWEPVDIFKVMEFVTLPLKPRFVFHLQPRQSFPDPRRANAQPRTRSGTV